MGGSETKPIHRPHFWWFGPRTLDPDSSSKSDRHSLIKYTEAALESLEAAPSFGCFPARSWTPTTPFVWVIPSEISRDHCHGRGDLTRNQHVHVGNLPKGWLRHEAVVYEFL
jgi:hypothetical protein